MLRRLVLMSLCGLALGESSLAAAQDPSGDSFEVIDPIDIPPDRDPLAHAWDQPDQRGGFYLRASMALGAQSTHLGPAPWKDDELGRRASGFDTGFNLDVGGVLRPWVALHLNAHAGVLWNGDVQRDFGIDDHPSARIAAYGAAPAVTFFTPHFFYFTGAFGVGIARMRYTGYDRTTNPGFYMNLVAGKDLYVDRNFSFGLQMQVVYMLLGANHTVDEARVREFLFGMSFGFDSI